MIYYSGFLYTVLCDVIISFFLKFRYPLIFRLLSYYEFGLNFVIFTWYLLFFSFCSVLLLPSLVPFFCSLLLLLSLVPSFCSFLLLFSSVSFFCYILLKHFFLLLSFCFFLLFQPKHFFFQSFNYFLFQA